MTRRGFSLIELIVVVVILGVIGAIAVPRLSGMVDRSRVQAAAGSVNAVRRAIEEYRATYGSPPGSVDATLFYNGAFPRNPYQPASKNPSSVQVVALDVTATDPSIKIVGSKQAFWYNRTNGEFRARVSDQGKDELTISLYNAVNGTVVTGLADTKSTSGSGDMAVGVGG